MFISSNLQEHRRCRATGELRELRVGVVALEEDFKPRAKQTPGGNGWFDGGVPNMYGLFHGKCMKMPSRNG